MKSPRLLRAERNAVAYPYWARDVLAFIRTFATLSADTQVLLWQCEQFELLTQRGYCLDAPCFIPAGCVDAFYVRPVV